MKKILCMFLSVALILSFSSISVHASNYNVISTENEKNVKLSQLSEPATMNKSSITPFLGGGSSHYYFVDFSSSAVLDREELGEWMRYFRNNSSASSIMEALIDIISLADGKIGAASTVAKGINSILSDGNDDSYYLILDSLLIYNHSDYFRVYYDVYRCEVPNAGGYIIVTDVIPIR